MTQHTGDAQDCHVTSLIGDVLAGIGPEGGQHQDLERFGDCDLYEEQEQGRQGPVGGSGGVERQAEDDGGKPEQ